MQRLEQAVLQSMLWILCRLPRLWVRPCVACLSPCLFFLAPKESRQFDRNVEGIFGLRPHSDFARMFKRQVAQHQLTCAVETLQAIHNPSCLQIEGFAELRQAIASAEEQGLGHIIVTAHLGSWELVALFGAKASRRPFRVLAKPARRAAMTEVLNQVRERMGVEVLWTDRKSILRDMVKTLRAAESVGFVMDQKPEGRQGPVVDFFNRPTEFVSGPAAMALKTGCAVIAVFCVRTGPYRFRIISSTLKASGTDEAADEISLTQTMASEIERVIRLYPEQWTWNYKRWRWSS